MNFFLYNFGMSHHRTRSNFDLSTTHMLFIVDDRIIFHMHLLTYEIAHFCIFLICVFDWDILDSFRRCVIAPRAYKSKNAETPKILCLVGKEFMCKNITGSYFMLLILGWNMNKVLWDSPYNGCISEFVQKVFGQWHFFLHFSILNKT